MDSQKQTSNAEPVVDRLGSLETIFVSLTLAMSFCLFIIAIATKYVVEGW
ncbi:MAG: hypothetical protein V4692_14160 [Bdellovibrionota bacterium]